LVISGGGANAAPTNLFYNRNTRKLGVIGLKHLVFFNEMPHRGFDDVEASLNMLKDYMQTEKFNRGDQEFSSQCSIVLGGNIDTDMSAMKADARYRHLFESLPPELCVLRGNIFTGRSPVPCFSH
jgi:ATP-dependent Lon protease